MAKYRKKPIVINAWRASVLLIDARANWNGLPVQIRTAYEAGDIVFADQFISIKTLEGTHRADISDLVICGVKGELYPCKSDIFSQTYDYVHDDEMDQPK